MKRIEKILKSALTVIILFAFLFPINTNAQIFGTSGDCNSDSDCTVSGYSCNTTLKKCQLKDPEKTGVTDIKTTLKDTGVTGTEDVGNLILKYVNFVLPFLAIAAFLAFIYAGILYVTAYGNDEQTGKAKKVIIYAVVGLILVILSYSIVQLLTGDLVTGIN